MEIFQTELLKSRPFVDRRTRVEKFRKKRSQRFHYFRQQLVWLAGKCLISGN